MPRRIGSIRVTHVVIAAGLAVACIVAVTAASVHGRPAAVPAHAAIERTDAEEVLNRAVRFARTGDFAGLCRDVATRRTWCKRVLDEARSQGWMPGDEAPIVLHTRHYRDSAHSSGTFVFHVAGVRADGSRYESDFPVLRQGNAGALKSTWPVYWSEMTLVGPGRPCDENPNEACARTRVTAPDPPDRNP